MQTCVTLLGGQTDMMPKSDSEMDASIVIRKCRSADYPAVEALFLRVRRELFSWHDASQYPPDDFYKQTAGEVVFVAEDAAGKIVGFVSVWEQDAFIHHLYVDPDYKRKGVGTALMNSLFSWLPFPYRLKCITRNRQALKFYRKLGWVEVERAIGEDGEYALLELRGHTAMIECTEK